MLSVRKKFFGQSNPVLSITEQTSSRKHSDASTTALTVAGDQPDHLHAFQGDKLDIVVHTLGMQSTVSLPATSRSSAENATRSHSLAWSEQSTTVDEDEISPAPLSLTAISKTVAGIEIASLPSTVVSANTSPESSRPGTASRPVSNWSRTSSNATLLPKPTVTMSRLSSLDNILILRQEQANWKRASSRSPKGPLSVMQTTNLSTEHAVLDTQVMSDSILESQTTSPKSTHKNSISSDALEKQPEETLHGFRHRTMEYAFVITICLSQFLAEFLISGFALELPKLMDALDDIPGTFGVFWPASILSLCLGASILVMARAGDKFGGYPVFMCGLFGLTVSTIIPGISSDYWMLCASRAIQGISIAAYTPSTFSMIGVAYVDGKRKNIVLGLYSAFAPLGFFAGMAIAGRLDVQHSRWYFLIAGITSFVCLVLAFLSVPSDRFKLHRSELNFDWPGAVLILCGLLGIGFAMSAMPYAGDGNHSGLTKPIAYAPFIIGVVSLIGAFIYEGWYATHPLLPGAFFKPKGVKAFCIAAMFFYATYGVWLYKSVDLFQLAGVVAGYPNGVHGVRLAAFYLPTALGGLLVCVLGSLLIHKIRLDIILVVSGVACIGAPLLLSCTKLPIAYAAWVLPSMLCATIGVDLTYTVSVIFLSSSQPVAYQGLAGAMSSVLLNLAMSFALAIADIISKTTSSSHRSSNVQIIVDQKTQGSIWSAQCSLYYAAVSAGIGLFICLCFVRIPKQIASASKEPAWTTYDHHSQNDFP